MEQLFGVLTSGARKKKRGAIPELKGVILTSERGTTVSQELAGHADITAYQKRLSNSCLPHCFLREWGFACCERIRICFGPSMPTGTGPAPGVSCRLRTEVHYPPSSTSV